MPAMYAPDLFKLSDTSFVLKVNASHIKQKEIISVANTNIYRGCPGFKAREILCKKPSDSL